MKQERKSTGKQTTQCHLPRHGPPLPAPGVQSSLLLACSLPPPPFLSPGSVIGRGAAAATLPGPHLLLHLVAPTPCFFHSRGTRSASLPLLGWRRTGWSRCWPGGDSAWPESGVGVLQERSEARVSRGGRMRREGRRGGGGVGEQWSERRGDEGIGMGGCGDRRERG